MRDPMRRICASLILVLFACRVPEKTFHAAQTTAVCIDSVRERYLSRPIVTSGILHSTAEIKLSFKIGGIVDELYVHEGDFVKEGKTLAVLKLDEIDAQVDQARTAFEKRQRDYLRAKTLYADSAVTLEQLQDCETAQKVARSQLDIAEFNRKHATISAPAAGTVLKQLVERGELVAQGYPVYLFGSGREEWRVKAGITDREVIRIGLNDSCRVSFDAYPDHFFHARIVEIAGAPDPLTGTYKIELSMHSPDYRLMQGFIARIAIYPSEKQKYTTIPFISLIEANGSHGFVFIPSKDNTAKKIPVTIDFLSDDHAVIKEGLEGITTVITDGAAYLTDNTLIKIVQSDKTNEDRQ